MSTQDKTAENLGGALAPTKERLHVLGIPETALDVPAYDAAMEKLVKQIPGVVSQDKKTRAMKYALGFLILDVRQTFKLANGEPDTFGVSDAYKKVYSTSIVQKVCARFKSVEETDVRSLLKDVQENYMRDNDKRKGMGLAYQRVIMDAVEAGKIPDATVEPTADGRLALTIRPTVVNDAGETVPVMETVSETVVNDDGTETVKTEEKPKETRYITGNPDAPKDIKKVVKDAVVKRGRKDQTIPVWAGGPDPAKSKPGPKEDNPVNAAETYKTAWETMTRTIPSVALPTAVQYATAGLTSIIDQVWASKGQGFNAKDLAESFRALGALSTAMARDLANNDEAKSDELRAKVEDLRYVPETTPEPEPETEPEENNDDADAVAADLAAAAEETS